MPKTLKDIKPIDDDDDDDVPELDTSKPIGVQANARIFGKVDVPEEGRKIAKPIALDKITPDPIQARQTIPLSIQQIAKRDGIAEWDAWHRVAEQMTGRTIDLPRLLRGEGTAPVEGAPIGSEIDDPETVKDFLELVGLAASIYRNGLINPISVVRVGGTDGQYQIESGEGRWWAHRILARVLRDKQWLKIPCLVMDEFSVWRQADENAARRPLNAIARARQLARLIMDLNREKGSTYTPYGEIVKEGESNRAFYAQVADGNKHRIPDGDVERVMTATGLKSRPAIAHYRALLKIPDSMWIEADEGNWAERKIREEMEKLKPQTFPMGNANSAVAPAHPPMSIKPGDGPGTKAVKSRVLYRGKEVEVYDYETRRNQPGVFYLINHIDENGLRTYSETIHSRETQDLPLPERGKPTGGIDYSKLPQPAYPSSWPQPPASQPPQQTLTQGQYRRNAQGQTYKVLSVLNGLCSVVLISPTTGKPLSTHSMPAAAVNGMQLVPAPVVNKDDFNPAAAREAIMGPDEDEEPIDTRLSGPDMPEGGWKQGMQVITFAGRKGVVLGTQGRDVHIETRDGERIKCFEGNMRLLSAREIEAEQTVDNPLSTQTDIQAGPPDWFSRGKTVLYKPSNVLCIIEGTLWDELENCWYARVPNGEGDWADLSERDCAPAIEEVAAPAPRHPALEAKNLTNAITEWQYKLGSIWAAAVELKMIDEGKQLNRMKVLTPHALATFLREDGEEGAYARIGAMYDAGMDVLNASLNALNAVRDEAYEVLRQMVEEKRAS